MTPVKAETRDREETHSAECYPHCDGRVQMCRTAEGVPSRRERVIEDIVLDEPETVLNKVTQYDASASKNHRSQLSGLIDAERLAKRLSDCHDAYSNQSDVGVNTQAILMSVFRTFNLQGRDICEDVKTAAQDRIRANHRSKHTGLSSNS